MATYKSHFSLSTIVAVAYSISGLLLLRISPEHIILASAVLIIAGILPDIDAGQGAPAREIGGLLAAVSPLILFEFYPELKMQGITRIVLSVILCYVLTRVLVNRLFSTLTSPRGVIHSIPTSIVIFELCYLAFNDVPYLERVYISAAAFFGFFAHLLLDASSNVDIVGKAMGGHLDKHQGALKFGGSNLSSTFFIYATMFTLGYFVFNDMYPGILPQIKLS